jgi:hypothetical protein
MCWVGHYRRHPIFHHIKNTTDLKFSFTIYVDSGIYTGHRLHEIPLLVADSFYEILLKENLGIALKGFEIACDMDKERSSRIPEGVAYQWLKNLVKETRQSGENKEKTDTRSK